MPEISEKSAAEMEQKAFELFAHMHPHEAYDTWPERFWAYFQGKCPGVTRAQMEQLLRDTAKEV